MYRALFQGLLVCVCVIAAAQQSPEHLVMNKVAAAKFVNLPNIPDCMTVAVERGDPNSGPSSVLVKMKPSCDSRTHWHTADASVLVVSGSIQLEMKDERTASMLRGDYVFLPSHHIHREKCSGSASCTFFAELYSPFDVHYVDKAGKEIPPEDALQGTAKSRR